MHYFGYGSNLNRLDLDRWCARRDLPALNLKPEGLAFLPDRTLAFSHRSTTRAGGVLDVPEAVGRAVQGVVFRCADERTLTTLDRKENEGHVYRRIEEIVITPGGGESPAFLYEVDPRFRETYVPPNPDYLDAVRRGYEAHGVELDALEEAAKGKTPAGAVATLFVYGTLRRGEMRHPILERHGGRLIGEGRIEGTLVDLGPHPGLIGQAREHPVVGEIYAFDDLARVLGETDRVEGFLGFGDPSSQYRRGVVSVSLGGDAPSVMAWTYLFAGEVSGLPVVPGGIWRRQHVT
ncbi:MAG TPA: gamma-glutamylcyclotransferase [Candidatus Polarisedimenticolaceae bacterium]|nr:gamma-glutamylcyclotransferase [Candidatus Polarisedimenticolaceae bacterium]